MYPLLVTLHSWNRWLVLAAIVASLVVAARGPNGSGLLKKVRIATVSLADLQFLVGIALWFASPMTPSSMEVFRSFMKDSGLRFFSVEHPFAMLLAVVALHVFSVGSKKAPDEAKAHKRWLVGCVVALLLVLAGIPWPGLPYERPLFRF